MHQRLLETLSLALLLVSCQVSAPDRSHDPLASQGRSDAASPFPIFPPAQGDLVLEWEPGGKVPSLLALLEGYAALTGQTLVIGPGHHASTLEYLERAHVPLTEPVRVPRDQVQGFVENLLVLDCVLVPKPNTEPRLLIVHSLRGPARSQAVDDAIPLRVEDLHLASAHPTVLFTFFLLLPHTDVRNLSNSLRPMITDPNMLRLIPGGAGNLLMAGPGTRIARIAAELLELDRQEARVKAPPVREVLPLSHIAAPEAKVLLGAAGFRGNFEPMQGKNTLMVACRPEDWPAIRDFLALLDRE